MKLRRWCGGVLRLRKTQVSKLVAEFERVRLYKGASKSRSRKEPPSGARLRELKASYGARHEELLTLSS